MSKEKSPVVILMGYVPLLYAQDIGFEPGTNVDPEVATSIFDNLDDSVTTVHACIWIKAEGGPRPVFLMKHADKIVDHIMSWTDNDPSRWFSLQWLEVGGRYCITLLQNIEESINRYRFVALTRNVVVPFDAEFRVVYYPLHFVSNVGHMFNVVKDKIASKVEIGFVSVDEVDKANPNSYNWDKVRWIGPFEFKHALGSGSEQYIASLMEEGN